MKQGALTYLIGLPGLFLAPVLAGAILLAPGLVGLLQMLGLGALAGVAYVVLTALAGVFLALAFVNARGSYHVAQHVRDMLPWAAMVIAIAAVAGALQH